jgi:hypothetical protein
MADPDTTAWVGQVTNNGGSVSAAREALVDALVVGLKNDAVWGKLDRLWLLAGENEPSARIDLIGRLATTKIGAPVFTVDRGYGGITVADYIDTNFNPATASGHFLQNDNSLSVWVETPPNQIGGTYPEAAGSYGSVAASLVQIEFNSDGGYWVTRMATGGGSYSRYVIPNNTGFISTVRPDPLTQAAYVNGTLAVSDGGMASLPLPNARLFIGNRSDDNTPQSVCVFTGGRIAALHVGGALTAADQFNLYNHVAAYMYAIGVAATLTPPSGMLAATETTDKSVMSGGVVIAGTLAATDAHDTAAFTGTIPLPLSGTLAATDPLDRAAIEGRGDGRIPAVPGEIPAVPYDRITSETNDRLVVASNGGRVAGNGAAGRIVGGGSGPRSVTVSPTKRAA